MKSFVTKVKNLSQKAAELKAAMQQLPPKVAEMRETIAATTGQLQQLKSEINFSVADLKTDSEERLSVALQEINGATDVFAKAGFLLGGVDIEISPVQRMQVHLTRVEDVHASLLRSLASANQQQRTVHAILTALLQAKQMADTVELQNLEYSELMVTVGPVPVVRLCWRPMEVHESKIAPPPLPAAPASAFASAPASTFGQSSFFEKRATPTAAPPQSAPVLPPPVVPQIIEVPSTTSVANSGTREVEAAPATDPLARFKKMPDLIRRK